ncbi:hypothetical protein SCLCIDRAFT_11925 [Scleroderma citrinum Foug A]|uniref:Uncharacterized protein n=1 Tax=Scleroderma citrinum Foug A TaxID=1036808 RepID=A0A0C3CUN9_9AGAM|nr:hypothetical protein SCLCIDRAFT_11925 [Scleroderma citrinum Foug A]
MEEQTIINTSKPGWEDDAEDASPPHASKNGEPHTQAEHLMSLHKSLESAMGTLNKLSIHTVLPECTISLVHELYHCTKTTSSVEQGPSDDILAAIRKLAKDIPPTVDPNNRLTGIKAVEATNIALAPHTEATIITVKWNDKGNCIAISHPDFTAMDLAPFGNTIAAAITGQNDIECTATPDKKWHCIILNGVDMGKTDIDKDIKLTQFQGRRPEEILKELWTNNPSLATTTIMEARWLTRPENLRRCRHPPTPRMESGHVW